MKKIRLFILAAISIFPSFLLRPLYRIGFGYRIGKGVTFGFSIIDVESLDIADNVKIGHFNLILGCKHIRIGENAKIGFLNVIRGGDLVDIGSFAEIIRLNEINSIPNPEVSNPHEPVFIMGDGGVITASHKIDFTDRVELGNSVIVGGRNSSLWTHNRQETKPIVIGNNAYLGSEIRIAPGGRVPANCVVGMGSVITKELIGEYKLIAGVPARVVKELGVDDRVLVEYRTHPEFPASIK